VEAFSGVDANSLLKGRKEHMQCEDKGKEGIQDEKKKTDNSVVLAIWQAVDIDSAFLITENSTIPLKQTSTGACERSHRSPGGLPPVSPFLFFSRLWRLYERRLQLVVPAGGTPFRAPAGWIGGYVRLERGGGAGGVNGNGVVVAWVAWRPS